MFEIDVPLPLWIISQAIGVVILGLVFWANQIKAKEKTLIVFSVASLLAAVATALIGNYVASAVFLVVTFRNLVFAWLAKPGNNVPQWLSVGALVFFIIAGTAAIYLTMVWWFDWVIMGLLAIRVYGTWRSGPHWIRLCGVLMAFAMIVNHAVFLNLMGILAESVILISVFIWYLRFFRDRKTPKPNEEEQTSPQL